MATKNKITSTYTHWVVGFLVRDTKKNGREVALVLKTRPFWQAGKLNGVGGRIEKGELPGQAMLREFKEEAGLLVKEWREFALLKVQDGQVHFFVAYQNGTIQSMTDEKVAWYPLKDFKKLPLINNLDWLLPLALDEGNRYATIDYYQKQSVKKTR